MNGDAFHYTVDTQQQIMGGKLWQAMATQHEETRFTYRFDDFFHPFVGELLSRLNNTSVAGMLDPEWQKRELKRDVFAKYFTAVQSASVRLETSPERLDLGDGPYAVYNWELLFHVPLTIASHLSANQRFEEAQRWFHLIFDPTSSDTSVPAPGRFWRFAPFREPGPSRDLPALLALLSKPDSECTEEEKATKQRTLAGYEDIRSRPFQPHAVARTRTVAYQLSVVMKYVTNLIDWGDTLFAQDTIETLNEATLRYVLAANILGPKPEQLPSRGRTPAKNFQQLRAARLDAMGNSLVELEGQFPFNVALPGANPPGGPPFGLGRTLYFSVPRNEQLLALWDRVDDRLFKLRHCMNLQGVVRQLALFDPPIDPAILVKAAAAEIDVGSIVSGLNQPIGPRRALPLIRSAIDLAGEVRELGNGLLAAMEKRDGEQYALLRQRHETALAQHTRELKFLALQQAREATGSLLRSRDAALERYRFYLRMLDQQPDSQLLPDVVTPDRRELTEENFDEAYAALVDQFDVAVPVLDYPRLPKPAARGPAAQSGAAGAGQLHLSATEDAELNEHMVQARDYRAGAAVAEVIAGILTFIPEFNLELEFWGLGGSSNLFGGMKLSDAIKIGAEIARTYATWESDQAGIAGRTAGHERRVEDWTLQTNLAARELRQIGRQLISSLITEQMARHDYETVRTQVAQSTDVEEFLTTGKQTTEDLYAWMQGELSRLYFEHYRFAVDTARRAERTMKHELMRPELDATDHIRPAYWNGGRKGLLAAEALQLDLRRMEQAYHDNNRREYELTRHVSLRQLDPLALLRLKATGRCEVTVPEWLFDRDTPGHYMRRLKHVALSIPAVVGPYTAVNCTMSLLRSSVRTSPLLKDNQYARRPDEDDRFADYLGAVESAVTSSGDRDSGSFEDHDEERFDRFEGAGAAGTWRLELPTAFRPFDYAKISDVVLHLRYTARAGGSALADAATRELTAMLATAANSGLALLLSLPHDFPSAWAMFAAGTGDLSVPLRKDLFPYLVHDRPLAVSGLDLYRADGMTLKRRPLALPAGLNAALAPNDGAFDLTVPADIDVLRRDRPGTYLILRYTV